MRTPDQIKRKLHELSARKQALEARLAGEGTEAASETAALIGRLEDQMLLLEWVLNEPTGSYHA